MTREELYEAIIEAMKQGGTGLAGAADELSFGGASRLAPEQFKQMEEERPTALTAGRVGSMFVPYGGVLGAARLIKDAPRIGKAIKAGMKMQEMLPNSSFGKMIEAISRAPEAVRLARMAERPYRAGAVGAAQRLAKAVGGGTLEAGGQAALRNVIGGEDNDVLSSGLTGGLTGAGVGALSLPARGMAKKLYRSPNIYNPTLGPKTSEYVDEMMDMGRWGGEDYFRGKAGKDLADYGMILSPKKEAIAKEAADPDVILRGLSERIKKEGAVGGNAMDEFMKKLNAAKSSLFENPTYGGAANLKETANMKLSELKPQQRAAAIFGWGDGSGSIANEDSALGALKRSIDAAEENKIVEMFGRQGKKSVEDANRSYARGKTALGALNKVRGVENPVGVPMTATGLAWASKDPAAMAGVAAAGGGFLASKSLSGRTGAGVALNKFGKDPERAAAFIEKGRATARSPRASEKTKKEEKNEYMRFLEESGEDEEENPYMRFLK